MAAAMAACGSDETTGFDEESSDQRSVDTAEVFAELGDATPGCAVGVDHPDGAHVDGFGMADLDAGSSITPATIFDLASVSKQLTGGVVAALVERGDVDLDAPVSEYVDDLGSAVDGVIVADLVHHTSGLPDYGDLLDAGDDETTTNGDVVDVLAAEVAGPDFDPGTEFEYSNSNYVLLALLAEGVTGRSFVDLSNDLIFDPLDMDATVVRDDQGPLLDGQAQGYAEDGEGDWEPVGSSWRQTGDGAVHSTVVDMLDWARLFFGDVPDVPDGVGSSAWLELMLTGGEVDDDGVPYGFGIGIDDGGGTLTHSGSWIGYGSVLTILPDEGIAVAIACNIDGYHVEAAAAEVLAIWQ